MRTRAAVARQAGGPILIEDLELDEPRRDEVLVRMIASGVCHTDAAVRDGVIPTPLPAVLGHEGAGIVEAVGADVTTVAVGDHVVLSASSCGTCRPCLRGEVAYCEHNFDINFTGRRRDGTTTFRDADGAVGGPFFGQSSFARYSVVLARSLVKVDRDLDLTLLAPLGCGMQTGAGAVLNELRPEPGSTFAVIGVGAVGSAALMSAVVSSCSRVIAVDVVDARLDLARELGATDVINSRREDLLARLLEVTGGRGVDYVLSTAAIPSVLRSAADALAVRGSLALVGSSPSGTEVPFEIGESLNKGWSFRTIIQGSSVPQTFIPALIELWRRGQFPFDRLITHYRFDDIDRAFDDSERGVAVKPVLIHDHDTEETP